jgi:pimeloyl-ACP methyl ester carboxylesterase
MRKNKFLLVALILGILGFASASSLARTFWSILVLSELLNFDSHGWLGFFTSSPKIQEVSYRGPRRMVRADLYLPRSGCQGSGILLNHGVIDTGKDDPRLKRFAVILCRAGFVVFVPDLEGMRSFHISPSDTGEVQGAFEELVSREETRPDSCGIFSFSYGAGPAMIAACRPEIRQKVRFLVSFGGYYDLKNVLSFIATGHFEFGDHRYFRKPQEYGKWVFLANNLDLVESPADRAVLKDIVQIKLRDEKAPVDHYLARLGGEGKNVLNLLSHGNPSQTEGFIRRLPVSVQSTMKAMNVSPVLKNLRADLILVHGEDDDLIPFTETLRLAEAAPDPGKVYLQILKTYAHVDPESHPSSLRDLFTIYLPEGWKLWGLIYQLMAYR